MTSVRMMYLVPCDGSETRTITRQETKAGAGTTQPVAITQAGGTKQQQAAVRAASQTNTQQEATTQPRRKKRATDSSAWPSCSKSSDSCPHAREERHRTQ
jgi:hypothetical protein